MVCRALKTKGNTPKYGLIFHSSFIGRAGAKNKGRISRYLANKCSIASRIDCFAGMSLILLFLFNINYNLCQLLLYGQEVIVWLEFKSVMKTQTQFFIHQTFMKVLLLKLEFGCVDLRMGLWLISYRRNHWNFLVVCLLKPKLSEMVNIRSSAKPVL